LVQLLRKLISVLILTFAALKISKSYKDQIAILPVLVLAFFAILFSSCRPEVQKFPFQAGTGDFFSSQDGELWIFKNRNNNSKDTLVSSESAIGFAKRSTNESEISSITLKSSMIPKMIIRAEAIDNQNIDRIAVLSLLNNTFIQGPVLLNTGGNFQPEDSSVLATKINVQLEGNNYPEVLDIELKGHPQFTNLWFAKSIGLIRIVFKNSDTLDLVQHTP
jgi:hypothetical protein